MLTGFGAEFRRIVLIVIIALAIGLPARRLNRSRDIRLAQEAVIAAGYARWIGDAEPPRAEPLPFDDLARAVERVRALFEGAGPRADGLPHGGLVPSEAAG